MSMGGHEFASDGYIWAPNEQAFQIETAGGHVSVVLLADTYILMLQKDA